MKLKQNKKVFFSDIVHCYLNDKGEELIGVTSLMKKHGLGADYSGIPQDVLERAAERGSRVHRLLETARPWRTARYCSPTSPSGCKWPHRSI